MVNFKDIEKRPYSTFFWSFIVTTIAVLFSTQVSYRLQVGNEMIDLAGLFAVMFTIIPSIYLFTTVIKNEEAIEEREIRILNERYIWRRHWNDLIFMMSYFFGVAMAFAFWSFILSDDLFFLQIHKINEIRTSITGYALVEESFENFRKIFFNNLSVFLFAFVFSLLFGTGAVFIIAWNASVLGVFIGKLSRSIFHIPIVTLNFLPHGLPEIMGYLCAGLAGSLLSAAIIRGHNINIITKIAIDCLLVVIFGIFLIVSAAFIEVYL